MRISFWSVAIFLLFYSCNIQTRKDDKTILAEVNGEKILLSDALKKKPDGLIGTDSANFVKEYLANTIKDKLIYSLAQKTIPENADIDSMVEVYKKSLLIFEYQQQVLNSAFSNDVSDKDLLAFYDENKSRFLSDQDLLKGVFLKVDVNAPNIDDLRRWCRKPNSESLDKIESYSVQNAVVYNYFMDDWKGLTQVAGSMPKISSNTSQYLRPGNTVEVKDEEFVYMLYVKDCVLRGKTAPFEYIKPMVKNVMLNTRKTEFLRKYEQDLFDKAVKDKKVIFY